MYRAKNIYLFNKEQNINDMYQLLPVYDDDNNRIFESTFTTDTKIIEDLYIGDITFKFEFRNKINISIDGTGPDESRSYEPFKQNRSRQNIDINMLAIGFTPHTIEIITGYEYSLVAEVITENGINIFGSLIPIAFEVKKDNFNSTRITGKSDTNWQPIYSINNLEVGNPEYIF